MCKCKCTEHNYTHAYGIFLIPSEQANKLASAHTLTVRCLRVLLHSFSRLALFNLEIRNSLTTATRGHREFSPHTLPCASLQFSMGWPFGGNINSGKILIGVKRSVCVSLVAAMWGSGGASRPSAAHHTIPCATIKIRNGREKKNPKTFQLLAEWITYICIWLRDTMRFDVEWMHTVRQCMIFIACAFVNRNKRTRTSKRRWRSTWNERARARTRAQTLVSLSSEHAHCTTKNKTDRSKKKIFTHTHQPEGRRRQRRRNQVRCLFESVFSFLCIMYYFAVAFPPGLFSISFATSVFIHLLVLLLFCSSEPTMLNL